MPGRWCRLHLGDLRIETPRHGVNRVLSHLVVSFDFVVPVFLARCEFDAELLLARLPHRGEQRELLRERRCRARARAPTYGVGFYNADVEVAYQRLELPDGVGAAGDEVLGLRGREGDEVRGMQISGNTGKWQAVDELIDDCPWVPRLDQRGIGPGEVVIGETNGHLQTDKNCVRLRVFLIKKCQNTQNWVAEELGIPGSEGSVS